MRSLFQPLTQKQLSGHSLWALLCPPDPQNLGPSGPAPITQSLSLHFLSPGLLLPSILILRQVEQFTLLL